MRETRMRHQRRPVADPGAVVPPNRRLRLLGLFLGVLAPLVVFGILAADVWDHDGFAWDAPILHAVHAHASPGADTAMIWVSRLGGAAGTAPLCTLAAVLLLRRRHLRAAIFLVLAYGGAEAIAQLAKLVFHTTRPHLWVSPAPASGYSFPSGHAMGSMALFAALALLAWRTRWRWPTIVLGMCAVLIIALSRLYLGVHYPSDILAAWLAALAWVVGLFLLLTTRRWNRTAALYEA